MRAPRAVALALLAAVVACSGGPELAEVPPGVSIPPSVPDLATGEAVVRFEDASVAAEVVSTQTGRALGLMYRRSLAEDGGMLFLFREPRVRGFWMKNTLVPLSIAYLSSREDGGFVVEAIMDMEPCRADPCPSYTPGTSFDAALEVNQGWFADHGVEVGDRATVDGELPTPE